VAQISFASVIGPSLIPHHPVIRLWQERGNGREPATKLEAILVAPMTEPMPLQATPVVWEPPTRREILRWPLPYQGLGDRWLTRGLALLARRQVLAVYGLEHVRPAQDPFILVVNHSTRREALLVPAVLVMHRGGRLIHFLADWNFRLIPGVGLLYRRGGAITVTRKSARPRILNVFKSLYVHPLPALERARAHLAMGRAVGVFPEGTVNRNPVRLLPGRMGAARLSLEMGVPVVPVGIRFRGGDPKHPISDRASMEIHIGPPLHPPRVAAGAVTVAEVQAWHAAIMREIGRLSGKAWERPKWGSGDAQRCGCDGAARS
jgi:1-acyl-sn-glycerol-3-phosphate acyltransferase